MNAAAAAVGLHLPRSGGSVSDDAAAVERALAGGPARLRFEPAIEARYEHDTGPGRTTRHIACNLGGVASFWILTLADPTLMPDLDGVLAPLRLAVVAAILGANLLLALCRRSLGGWPRETISAVCTLLIVGYGIVVAHHVGRTDLVMRLCGLISIFLHVSIAARLRFPFALVVNLAVYLAYAALARADSAQAQQVVHSHLLLLGLTVVFCSAGNYLLEYRERRSYLLRRLEGEREQALRADAEALRRAAIRDGLTHIHNRRHFETELALRWSAALRQGGAVGVLQIDVDHFKAYNDRYGHPAGDRCLVEVAQALDAVAKAHGGIAARVGGEEFALLLPVERSAPPGRDADRAEGADLPDIAGDVLARIRALGLPHLGSGCAAHVTVSIGAAVVSARPELAPSSCVAAADAALYAAKAQGRDRSILFEGPPPKLPASTPKQLPPPGIDVDPERARIDALATQLQRRGARLRFPQALETDFQEQGAEARRQTLLGLLLAGLALVVAYAAMSAPVLGDIAVPLLRRVMLTAAALAVGATVVLRSACSWRWREGSVSVAVATLGLCIVGSESQATTLTVYTATVALCLLPMFASLIAAQPFAFSLVPSALICIGVGTLMNPGPGARQLTWLYTLGVLCTATTYTLAGGYLLERAKRRSYLLDRLAAAQLDALRRNAERLQRLAQLDPLTGLPNRRQFDAELDRLATLTAARREPLGLLIVDIDYFKRYNDAYGHLAGDECLRRVGEALADWARRDPGSAPPRLSSSSAGPPLVARMGGEEFGVLLPGRHRAAALTIAGQLCALLSGLGIEHGRSSVAPVVTASIGAASRVLDEAADARLLLVAADQALYRAKERGRDQAAA